MEEVARDTQFCDDGEEEFYDALDDFPFYECKESFFERVESSGVLSISVSNSNLQPEDKAGSGDVSISVSNSDVHPEDKARTPATLRRRRSFSRHKSSDGGTMEMTNLSSSVSLENYLKSRERDIRISRKHMGYDENLRNENSDSVELRRSCESKKDTAIEVNKDQNGESSSALTDASDSKKREDLVRAQVDLRENHVENSSFLLALAGLIVKAVTFQIVYLFKMFMFPIWLSYYTFMLIFNPIGLLMCGRGHILRIVKKIWSLVCKNVSPIVYEWFKEHTAIWKLGLKCSWGLLWSGYVCSVLVGLLVSAFVMGGILTRGVEEPIKMKRSLNFDYTEKSPVAFVPITTYHEVSHDIYLGQKPEPGKAIGLRVIPPKHKLQATVSLTLPESDYNQNLGIFQIRIDFLAHDGKILATSRRPCMLRFRSLPIRLLLTFLKIAPILTGYTSETQNLKISFRGFTEGAVPTACLRVIIEQRAEFHQGAGIPEIYSASLMLESELPLLKKVIWSWKKTLFVWISMTIFTMELVFTLLCCKPFIFPRIRLRGATNGGASQNDRLGQS